MIETNRLYEGITQRVLGTRKIFKHILESNDPYSNLLKFLPFAARSTWRRKTSRDIYLDANFCDRSLIATLHIFSLGFLEEITPQDYLMRTANLLIDEKNLVYRNGRYCIVRKLKVPLNTLLESLRDYEDLDSWITRNLPMLYFGSDYILHILDESAHKKRPLHLSTITSSLEDLVHPDLVGNIIRPLRELKAIELFDTDTGKAIGFDPSMDENKIVVKIGETYGRLKEIQRYHFYVNLEEKKGRSK